MPYASHGVAVFHGFTSTSASVQPVAEGLIDAGFTVDSPLLPGHGTSWQELARTPHEAILRAAVAAYDRLSTTCTTVSTAGLSMGGALALHVAAHREVSSVVAINPALRLAPLTGAVATLLHRLKPTVQGVAGDIARRGAIEEAYERSPVRGVAELTRLMAVVRGELSVLEARGTPVCLLRSARDNVLPPSSADTLVKTLTRLEVVTLERSLHVATLDHDDEIVRERTVSFIREMSELPGGGSDGRHDRQGT